MRSYYICICIRATHDQPADCLPQVEILFRAAYRRNYPWGRYASESWAQTADGVAPGNYQKVSNGNPQFDPPSTLTLDANQNGVNNERFFIRMLPFNGNLGDCWQNPAACAG
eukprot:2759478-Pyramimonas_sp.AAC.2